MRLRTPLSLVFVFLSTPVLADGVKAVTTTSKVSVGAESVQASSVTLQQALAKPDTTKVVLAGKETTVGELRKRAKAREVLATSKPPIVKSGAAIKGPLRNGSAEANSLVALARQESSAALAQRTTKGSHAARVVPSVGIDTVNGKERGFVVSPGGNVTIMGGQFGDTIGQVNVIGQFPGGAAPLRVVDWRAGEIHALFPPGLRGALDHQVTLQVITSGQKTFRLDGGKFIAAREDVVVTTGLLRMVQFYSAGSWSAQMDENGVVNRAYSGEHTDCLAPAKDGLKITDPGRGFFVTGVSLLWTGRTDSGDGSSMGDDGNRIYYPGYGFTEWYHDEIGVKWGVWRSHQSPYFLLPAFNQCQSSYQLAVILSGPAGVAPF